MTSAEPRIQRPLYPIALGLLIALVDPAVDGWDVVPDWLGWVLVLLGSRALAPSVERGGLMLACAALAVASTASTWPPSAAEWLADADPSVAWGANLPALGWMVLYGLGMAKRSRTEPGVSFWWKYLAILNGGAALLPVLVYGGGLTSLETLMAVLLIFGFLFTMMFSFFYARRDWAGVPA